MNEKTIIWHRLPNENEINRIDRLNNGLHRIFFEGKEICPDRFLQSSLIGDSMCHLCDVSTPYGHNPRHSTPRFLESLDAMQLIVESGTFAEVREEFFHWLSKEEKPAYECTILLYERKQSGHARFSEKGYTRQDAFYLTALRALGHTVIREEQRAEE